MYSGHKDRGNIDNQVLEKFFIPQWTNNYVPTRLTDRPSLGYDELMQVGLIRSSYIYSFTFLIPRTGISS